MSLETLQARIKKEALSCANCGGTEFSLTAVDMPVDPKNAKPAEMYFLWCKSCPHKRLEIDYDQAEENKKVV